MPFSAGELCCSNAACVLLDTASGTTATWDRIPHVTQISFTESANTPKLTTSSTGGRETSACGVVSANGNLAIACHGGTAPGYLAVNSVYHLRWASDCDAIWTSGACPTAGTVVSSPSSGSYFEAYVRITSLPIDMNISGNAALLYNYAFDIVAWVEGPSDNAQTGEASVATGFFC